MTSSPLSFTRPARSHRWRVGWSEVGARPPGRLLRLVFKAPVALYRAHLGWLLGDRFILLTHTGRNTGRARCTVIEVVAYDRSIPEVVVIAAWGEHAQWVRNLKAAPAIGVQLGRVRWLHPEHRFMEPAQAVDAIAAYRSRHPFAARMLARLLGWPRDTDDPAYERFVQTLCAVSFRPASVQR
jgi:deazaflavin-dependent oxidoreductase (nitroreductase family)